MVDGSSLLPNGFCAQESFTICCQRVNIAFQGKTLAGHDSYIGHDHVTASACDLDLALTHIHALNSLFWGSNNSLNSFSLEKQHLEDVSLLCLKMIETALGKQESFLDALRQSGATVIVSSLDKLLLGINPRTGRSDHLVNIAKWLLFFFANLISDFPLLSVSSVYSLHHID